MNKPEDYQEVKETEPFNVADHLDEPQVIEAHIGNLLAEIDRLRALLADITAIAARG